MTVGIDISVDSPNIYSRHLYAYRGHGKSEKAISPKVLEPVKEYYAVSPMATFSIVHSLIRIQDLGHMEVFELTIIFRNILFFFSTAIKAHKKSVSLKFFFDLLICCSDLSEL